MTAFDEWCLALGRETRLLLEREGYEIGAPARPDVAVAVAGQRGFRASVGRALRYRLWRLARRVEARRG